MGRAPCCDKVGLKRGPWTCEEDQVLISFIQHHGHSNWRALPKQAGLLRCGKSCRLRWINYLKPDIKRGNFSKEEEDTIIQLHQMMGNRWSAIAARLPGRTDNEIKNVWHTHLKKRLDDNYNPKPKSSRGSRMMKNKDNQNVTMTNSNNNSTSTNNNFSEVTSDEHEVPNSSQWSYISDDFYSLTDVSSVETPNNMKQQQACMDAQDQWEEEFPIIDDTFWTSPELSYDTFSMDVEFPGQLQIETTCQKEEETSTSGVDFWLDVLVNAGGAAALELPELGDLFVQ